MLPTVVVVVVVVAAVVSVVVVAAEDAAVRLVFGISVELPIVSSLGVVSDALTCRDLLSPVLSQLSLKALSVLLLLLVLVVLSRLMVACCVDKACGLPLLLELDVSGWSFSCWVWSRDGRAGGD
jgi:hypothetical protein